MTQTEWENEMCIKILELIQNELYVDFRYLDVAVSALTLTPNDSLRSTATDGISFFFPPEQIGFVETATQICGTFPATLL